MANSLRDQLLKAGLVTQEQVNQAAQPKSAKNKAPAKLMSSSSQAGKAKSVHKAPPPPTSDLEQFYKEREQLERAEREEEERRKREMAARRKQTRAQVRTLITANLLNTEEADIRYNFTIGDNIKYLFVTKQQQQDLAEGKIAITFMEGKRCLIPAAIARQLLELDPDKIVVISQSEENSPPPAVA